MISFKISSIFELNIRDVKQKIDSSTSTKLKPVFNASTLTIVSHSNNRRSHRQNPFHSGGVPRRRMLLPQYPGSASAADVRKRWSAKKVRGGKERSAVGGGKGSAKVHCHGRSAPHPIGKVSRT